MILVFVMCVVVLGCVIFINNDFGVNSMNTFLGCFMLSFSFALCGGNLPSYLEGIDMHGSLLTVFVWVWLGWLYMVGELNSNQYGIFVMLGLGVFIILLSDSWLALYLGLELVGLSVVLMLGSSNVLLRNVEAMVKYFVVSSVSSGIFLLGVLMIYWNTGSLSLSYTVFTYVNGFCIGGLGLDLIRVSLLIKLGSWPFYNWYLDVLTGVNNSQGLLLTTIAKLGTLYLLMVLGWVNWLYIVLVCGALVSLLGLLSELRVGSFIGYSGLVSDVLLLFSLSLSVDSMTLYLYLITYFFNIWLVWRLTYNSYISTGYVSGLGSSISLWSLGGLPPLLGFYVNWWLLASLLCEAAYWVVFVVLFSGIWLVILYSGWVALGNEQSKGVSALLCLWSNTSFESWVLMVVLLPTIIVGNVL